MITPEQILAADERRARYLAEDRAERDRLDAEWRARREVLSR
jgi:hypothetical protein